MAIAKPQRIAADVRQYIREAVNEAVKATVLFGTEQAKTEAKNLFKQTELRLYAYPELRNNIAKYNLDIKDLERERPGRSKDVTFFSAHGGGVRLSEEEIQEARIMVIRKKINRDQDEISEIEYALEAIKTDEYYFIIAKKYFEGTKDDDIAKEIPCDERTVRRHKNRLVRKIAIKLYGAAAV